MLNVPRHDERHGNLSHVTYLNLRSGIDHESGSKPKSAISLKLYNPTAPGYGVDIAIFLIVHNFI
jgi:hypothetical protein